MRLLIVTSRLARPGDSTWLIDDLVAALVDRGHKVDVVVGDLKRPRPRGWNAHPTSGVRVYSVGPEVARLGAARFWAAGARAARFRGAVRQLSSAVQYDAVLFSTIAFLYARSPYIAKRRGAKVGLFLWDFFPVDHAQIGAIPGWFPKGLPRLLERWAVGFPDATFVMSPRNAEFAKAYFNLPSEGMFLCPPWSGDRDGADIGLSAASSDSAVFTAVFGGQLAVGRGLEQIVECASLLEARKSKVKFIVAGDGPRRDWLTSEIAARNLSNIAYLGNLNRDEYRDLLRDSTVGIAATVPGVTAPTFPSKIGDYCAQGLPVVVATEDASDVGEFVEERGAGVSVPAGSASELAEALLRLEDEWRVDKLAGKARRARELFESSLSADAAAVAVLEALS